MNGIEFIIVKIILTVVFTLMITVGILGLYLIITNKLF